MTDETKKQKNEARMVSLDQMIYGLRYYLEQKLLGTKLPPEFFGWMDDWTEIMLFNEFPPRGPKVTSRDIVLQLEEILTNMKRAALSTGVLREDIEDEKLKNYYRMAKSESREVDREVMRARREDTTIKLPRIH